MISISTEYFVPASSSEKNTICITFCNILMREIALGKEVPDVGVANTFLPPTSAT